MATLTNLRDSIAQELGLDNSVSGDQPLIDRRLNEAVVDVLLKTGCYVKSSTMNETSGTGDYTLDAAILQIKGWSWQSVSGDYSNPMRVTQNEILRLRAATQNTSTVPATCYALAGTNLLMVYPTPTGADTITIYYVPRPTAMSSGSHDSSNATYGGIPEEFSPAIELYALARLASFDDDQSSAQGQRYRDEYRDWIRDIHKRVMTKGGRPARARVNRRRLIYPSPSADLY